MDKATLTIDVPAHHYGVDISVEETQTPLLNLVNRLNNVSNVDKVALDGCTIVDNENNQAAQRIIEAHYQSKAPDAKAHANAHLIALDLDPQEGTRNFFVMIDPSQRDVHEIDLLEIVTLLDYTGFESSSEDSRFQPDIEYIGRIANNIPLPCLKDEMEQSKAQNEREGHVLRSLGDNPVCLGYLFIEFNKTDVTEEVEDEFGWFLSSMLETWDLASSKETNLSQAMTAASRYGVSSGFFTADQFGGNPDDPLDETLIRAILPTGLREDEVQRVLSGSAEGDFSIKTLDVTITVNQSNRIKRIVVDDHEGGVIQGLLFH